MNLQAELITDLTSHLTKNGEIYELCRDEMEQTSLIKALESLVPFTPWSRVDWDVLPKSQFWTYKSWDEQIRCVEECKRNLPKSEHVVVIWQNCLKPALTLSIEAFKRNAIQIFDECTDTWVYDPNGRFVLENHYDGCISLFKRDAA